MLKPIHAFVMLKFKSKIKEMERVVLEDIGGEEHQDGGHLIGLTQKVKDLMGRIEVDKKRLPLEMEKKGRELMEMMDACCWRRGQRGCQGRLKWRRDRSLHCGRYGIGGNDSAEALSCSMWLEL
ncbi:hypothetical protein ACHAXS_004904 [Conticribra weissflogii]